MSYEVCDSCDGTGFYTEAGKRKVCMTCNGKGKVFWEPQPTEEEVESMRADGDHLQDWVK